MSQRTATRRLLVTRQDAASRRYETVGQLSCVADGYRFEYDAGTSRPLPGLPLGKVHESGALFSVFAERVMSPLRADYQQTLGHLGLAPDAGPFEVLAVSGGQRTGDTYEVTPMPAEGSVDITFLVHGIRYLTESERAHIDTLKAGQELQLVREPTNSTNPRATLVTDKGDIKLGYVPDPLVTHVAEAMGRPHHRLTVERVNPPAAGFHMRLLVRLQASE